MKVKNKLLDYDCVIFQNDQWFKFSLDSVLLVNFVTLNLRCKKIIDLATGNAPIPLLLSYKTQATIYGIELQKEVFKLGVESIIENKLQDRINLICGDVRKIGDYYESESFDTVLCNPPYFAVNKKSFVNDNSIKKLARHEITLSLDDVVKSARFLLKNGGNFAMVHRTERFIEVVNSLRKYDLEPKKIQFIYPKVGKDSNLFLIEACKNGKSGIKVLPELVVHNDDNSYTDYVRKFFNV